MPEVEATFMRDASIYISLFMEVLIFAVLFVLIFYLIKKIIINNLHIITRNLSEITGGNLNVQVDVRTSEEFSTLSDDINLTVATLKRYIAEAAARIDKELEYAKQPLNLLKNDDLAINAAMMAAKEVGGDFYDYYYLDDKHIAFLVADVSGKGIPAALFMVIGKTLIKDHTQAGADLKDVLKLIDLCEEFAFVDMEQIYMMGISRGGMMTYMATREDSRIKKAVVISGVSDAFMNYEERIDMQEVYKELVGETPDSNSEEYIKRSATYWADEIKCPILIIHSKLDKKVSFEQAETMTKALEEAGKEYKLISYEDDVHGLHPDDFSIIMEWCQ